MGETLGVHLGDSLRATPPMENTTMSMVLVVQPLMENATTSTVLVVQPPTTLFPAPTHGSQSRHIDFSLHPDLDLLGDSHGTDDDASAEDQVDKQANTSHWAPAFNSDAYQALLLRVQTMARESSERWTITETRHADYLSRFHVLY